MNSCEILNKFPMSNWATVFSSFWADRQNYFFFEISISKSQNMKIHGQISYHVNGLLNLANFQFQQKKYKKKKHFYGQDLGDHFHLNLNHKYEQNTHVHECNVSDRIHGQVNEKKAIICVNLKLKWMYWKILMLIKVTKV